MTTHRAFSAATKEVNRVVNNQTVTATVGKALRETGAALKHASGAEIYATLRPSMMLNGVKPFKTHDTFIAPSASVIGDVTNWDESSVWYGCVVRGDRAAVEIGFKSNLQDRVVVNTVSKLESGFPSNCHIGHFVSVGAGSVLVSCRVEDIVDIGEKCTIMEGALIETQTVLEPGTVVPPYGRIPSGQRWGGNPAVYISDLNEAEIGAITTKAEHAQAQGWEHLTEFLPYGNSYKQLEELEKDGVEAIKG
jgi:carbonic anhydrase/acetyltransferase-like protein (isoleucine patch superfamily)